MLDPPPPRRARSLMLQGTSSDVGKSLLVAGLARAYARRGLKVAPFKAQNMSNNAAVAADSDLPPGPDGTAPKGEIGRAQALQAQAAGLPPSIHMNPVLLKPQAMVGSQVVLRGRPLGNWPARHYHKLKPQLLPAVMDSFNRVAAEADLVLVEGAGAGTETYLRKSDIANMRFAEAADLPVVLVTDNDRGGAMAAVVGSWCLHSEAERARIAGYLVNKFRGYFSLYEPACETITATTGWPFLGVARWFEGAGRLPAEDALALERPASGAGQGLVIAVPHIARMANFDDLDPLSAEPGVDLRWVRPGEPIPAEADLVLLPGSKTTRPALDSIRANGWDIDILAHLRRGGRVLGICAGFQMLGHRVHDPEGIEGPPGETEGLGLLDIETTIGGDKRLVEIAAEDAISGTRVTGYEMHMGVTRGPGLERPWLRLDGRAEGAVSADGRVMGGYLHGLFGADGFRRHWLTAMGGRASGLDHAARVEAALDALADQLEHDLDLDALLALAR
ncbi:cobyric acid synthase [Rhodovulum sulfidophilum]|uniref:cobyric acid synthase n=1 Tax=Rhodovulum sulfidophilum TaxID=35806 RepID=UPI00138A2B87|nr:cobyric acid synthase [Rhodovulum sulfidophilum]MBL3572796.1 cobyric acid synthase [Rhodovulum sulfidophilum]MCE8417175.1 cobyric acid synthase [Rhodovulum sulfidophilum]MCE8430365.1 cobyric acid synthase [Rhodovulum sulfidophilum]MCF4117095.1 cobyric acid synthase [Rhodovulum sulfidophilum]NDK34305.1 cobyric acid synthase [Rhodovulum sulfidophilum]